MSGARFGWLASYPRSGNTWLRFLLASLQYPDAPLDINAIALRTGVADRREFDEYLGVESSELSEAEIEIARPALHTALIADSLDPLIFRKVHDRYWHTRRGEAVFPAACSHGAVYLVRDPRDVALSLSAFKGIDIEQSIDFINDSTSAFADNRIQPKFQLIQPVGTWSQHVESWLDQREIPVHVLRYEDLLADTSARLAEVASFFGLPTEQAPAAASRVTFSALQTQEKTKEFVENPREGGEKFFRRGKAGGWRNKLTLEQCKRIETAHGAVMHRLAYL